MPPEEREKTPETTMVFLRPAADSICVVVPRLDSRAKAQGFDWAAATGRAAC